jgi:hypothetical protein
MPFQGRGRPPFPDHRRVHRASEPRTRGLAPALYNPLENGNQVSNAVAVLLNRAGNHPRNPILKGLGMELSLALGLGDSLKGIYVFQRHAQLGSNLLSQATLHAPGVHGFAFMVGSGQTLAGEAGVGAKKNFVRIQTARGSFEREFWAQEHEHDVVTLNGEAALDPESLQPVEISAEIVDGSLDWLEVRTDFMVSWADEFLNLHRAETSDPETGFAKAYGGAAWVSFFDTDPGTEGVGTQVNPLNQVAIHSRRTIQIENAVGLKEITARFRSKQGSPYFVDIPLLIRVIDQDEVCLAPVTMPCTDLYVKAGAATPTGLPSTASVPMVQVVPGPAGTVEQELLFITMRGATVGGSPKLRIRRWSLTTSAPALMGARLVQLDDLDYLPLIQSAGTPETEAPYGDAHRYTVALSVNQLSVDNVAFIEAVLVDGTKPGMPILVLGPRARDLGFMPIGSGGRGTGGGPVCSPY